MKHIYTLISSTTLLIVTILTAADVPQEAPTLTLNPLLVVVIMVKDEAPVIRETLQPFIDGGIDTFLVFDTGSTDETVTITENFFKEHKITNGVIKQEKFVDFSTSRNRALQLVQETFPQAEFMLMPDAEWYMKNAHELLTFCEQHKNDPTNCYLVRMIMNGTSEFYTPRLFKCHSGVRFDGVVHEAPIHGTTQKVPSSCHFTMHGSAYGQEKTRKRWKRDLVMLLKEYEEKPHSSRTVFYIAQTYSCLEDWYNACQWYEKRVTMRGWDEEDFMARYRLGTCYENLGCWDQALFHYLKAFNQRPTRVEPLINLTQHYIATNEPQTALIFAKRAIELPYPLNDVLFVEKDYYDNTRYELLKKIVAQQHNIACAA